MFYFYPNDPQDTQSARRRRSHRAPRSATDTAAHGLPHGSAWENASTSTVSSESESL